MEAARQNLIVETAANKKALHDLEVKILQILSESEGSNILENEEATKVLDSSKYLVDDIKAKQKVKYIFFIDPYCQNTVLECRTYIRLNTTNRIMTRQID